MYRSVAVIAQAIALSQPSMPRQQLHVYASIVQKEAVKRSVDPFTIVSIVHHESHWNPRLVSRDREDHGLGQVRARFIGACRQDADPLNAPSAECQAVKASLLTGAYNLQVMGSIISRNRRYCAKQTGRAHAVDWISSYAGINRPGEGVYCGRKKVRGRWVSVPVNPHIRNILKYRHYLVRMAR